MQYKTLMIKGAILGKNQLEDYEKLTNKMDRENEKMLLMSVVFFTYAEAIIYRTFRIKKHTQFQD